MKKILLLFIVFISCQLVAQNNNVDTTKIKLEFENLISHLESNYVYYHDKDVDLNCIKEQYKNNISNLKNSNDVLLFFEYLLNEFYDSHFHLNRNIKSSYRLSSPLYLSVEKNKIIIKNIWKEQIVNYKNLELIDAEVLTFNGIDFNLAIENFPTLCQNKNNLEIRTWISNKIISGRYNEPRLITYKTKSGKVRALNIDNLKIKEHNDLLSYYIQDSIGIIKINNSLGNVRLKRQFKKAIKELQNTTAIILDLRNTVDGGNTFVANPMAGHFISTKTQFQKYKNKTANFVDYIKPNKPYYEKELIVLVGRWTGSMGEGLANGFNGINRAKIVGTEMQKLAGATAFYKFKGLNYGCQYPYIDILNLNNTKRVDLVPEFQVKITNSIIDDILEEGIKICKSKINKKIK